MNKWRLNLSSLRVSFNLNILATTIKPSKQKLEFHQSWQVLLTDIRDGRQSSEVWRLGFIWSTHQKKHAAALFHGTTAPQETQNHDGSTHSNQDIHSNIGVNAGVPIGKNLKIKKRNQKFPLLDVFLFTKNPLGTYYVSGPVLGPWDISVIYTEGKNPCPQRAYILLRCYLSE